MALLANSSIAAAADPDTPPSPAAVAARIQTADDFITTSAEAATVIAAEPAGPASLDQVRHQLRVADSEFRYRQAIRAEQVMVYGLATDPDLEGRVVPRLSPGLQAALGPTIQGLRAFWRSAGITDYAQIRLRWNRRLGAEASLTEIRAYYQAATQRYSVDWSYLASINYIESDFGRINGPSSAGAMGPMQFMPTTWADVGNGGDIMSSHDSIDAAARYLSQMGAPSNMARAIYRYNNDDDYVAAVQSFAAAFRADPTWLDRLYYWSTTG